MERIYINEEQLQDIIEKRRFADHLERYLMIRRFLYGTVVDLGCGIGYGSRLMIDNPDVEKVIGYDICEDTIKYAKEHFSKDGVYLTNESKLMGNSDVLVALELIEHIEDSSEFYDYVKVADPNMVIISFPNKPSTSYNPYHHHDYVKQDIVDIMKGYIAVKSIDVKDVTLMIFLKAPKNMPYLNYHNFLEIWD